MIISSNNCPEDSFSFKRQCLVNAWEVIVEVNKQLEIGSVQKLGKDLCLFSVILVFTLSQITTHLNLIKFKV